jgi:DNA-binding transcriptional MerR regulator
MEKPMNDENRNEYSLRRLYKETGVPERTIRFYISRGLVDRPLRSGRHATYGEKHRHQIEAVRTLKAKGLMLDEIARVMQGSKALGEITALRMTEHLVEGVCRKLSPGVGKMLWFEADGSLDDSQLAMMEERPDQMEVPAVPASATWRLYEVAPDVRVMFKTGGSPWRIRALEGALRWFAKAVNSLKSKEDQGE